MYTLICDKCLRACCWHGLFCCDEYKEAGLLQATEEQLRRLDREHSDYYLPYMSSDEDRKTPYLSEERIKRAERGKR